MGCHEAPYDTAGGVDDSQRTSSSGQRAEIERGLDPEGLGSTQTVCGTGIASCSIAMVAGFQ
jgi:hypothetical protein